MERTFVLSAEISYINDQGIKEVTLEEPFMVATEKECVKYTIDHQLKKGDKIQIGRIEYTIFATFIDNELSPYWLEPNVGFRYVMRELKPFIVTPAERGEKDE